jgi:hypothetical protein
VTIVRARGVFIVLAALLFGSLGPAVTPAAAQAWPVQRFTLNGMWADVTTAPPVAGDGLFILVDLVPHDSGLPVQDRRVTVDLAPLGLQRTIDLRDEPGDASPALVLFHPLSVYGPAGDLLLRFTASADLGRGGTFDLPVHIAPAVDADADRLPDVWEAQFGLSAASATGLDGADGDPDSDGRSNHDEYLRRSHPRGLYTRYFPEGVGGDFFRHSLDTAPLPGPAASLLIRTLDGDGLADVTAQRYTDLGGTYGRTLALGLRSAAGSFAQIVEADVPFTATRSTTWPKDPSGTSPGYGSHASEGTSVLSRRWLFAEGVTGEFDTYLTLVNPSIDTATVAITYVGGDGVTPVVRQHTIAPERRGTISVNLDAASLASTDVAFIVDSSVPIAAERSVYRHVGSEFWGAGTSSVGAPAASTAWYFAEGVANPVFDTYLLLLNPGETTAQVSIEILRADGLPPLVISHTLAPGTRGTVHLNTAHPELAGGSTSFGLIVKSINDVPIVAERTMWWDDPIRGTAWIEGHTSMGAPELATTWCAGGNRLDGGESGAAYLLIANPADTTATVRVSRPRPFGPAPALTVDVAPHSRITLDLATGFTADINPVTAAVLVESLGPSPVPLVVERSVYASRPDATWTLGSNTLLTPVRVTP